MTFCHKKYFGTHFDSLALEEFKLINQIKKV